MIYSAETIHESLRRSCLLHVGEPATEPPLQYFATGKWVLRWGRVEYLKTFGSLRRETLIKIKILIGIARTAYLVPHLAILHRAFQIVVNRVSSNRLALPTSID